MRDKILGWKWGSQPQASVVPFDVGSGWRMSGPKSGLADDLHALTALLNRPMASLISAYLHEVVFVHTHRWTHVTGRK
jgi:hypothetical protein